MKITLAVLQQKKELLKIEDDVNSLLEIKEIFELEHDLNKAFPKYRFHIHLTGVV